MNLVNPWILHQGPGRYAMPIFLLEHKDLYCIINELGKTHYEDMKEVMKNRTEERNPQTIHKALKNNIVMEICKYSKSLTSKVDHELKNLEKNKEEVLNKESWSKDKRRYKLAILDKRISKIKRLKMGRSRDNTTTKFFLEEECLQKPCINANKELTPWDMIAVLRNRNMLQAPLTRRSDAMSKLARKHHEDLQEDEAEKNPRRLCKETKEVLNHIKTRLSHAVATEMATDLTNNKIEEAMRQLPNGKAAGLDGIPHKVCKNFLEGREVNVNPDITTCNSVTQNEGNFNVIEYLTMLYNNIGKHGVAPGMGFADGWLCPIYKKGNCTDIGNYRPITVLNMDYKIITKALTNRLTNITPGLIHPN